MAALFRTQVGAAAEQFVRVVAVELAQIALDVKAILILPCTFH